MTTTLKEELHNTMVDMFSMIEDMKINEGAYLQFADMFKNMNINITKLAEIQTVLQTNTYYINHVRPANRRTSIQRKRLTEGEKAISPQYSLCNCGRYIAKGVFKEHLKTQVHYQGRRNCKYASKRPDETEIKFEINREVLIQRFIIKHLCKVRGVELRNV